MSRQYRHLAAVAAAIVVLPGAAVSAQAAPSGEQVRPQAAASRASVAGRSRTIPAKIAARAAGLTWTRCGGGLQCATLDVPLDYSDPRAGTTFVRVVRRPADKPQEKVGVLFTNPGGPGVAAGGMVPSFADVLGRTVRQKFDIIGIDPRGTAESNWAYCTDYGPDPIPWPIAPVFPITPVEIERQLTIDKSLQDECAANAPQILKHMSTADVARDMDQVRAALGQEKINYYGVSYGSVLGATYAALFPDRVRTLAVDGALDPVAWSTGRGERGAATPMTTRINSHVGAYEALMSAIGECERSGPAYCDQDTQVRQDWADLRSLRDAPLDLYGWTLTYDYVVGLVASGLYDPAAVPDTLQFIHETAELQRSLQGSGMTARSTEQARASIRALRAKLTARDAANRRTRIAYNPPEPKKRVSGDYPDRFGDHDVSRDGVICSDAVQPNDPQAWVAAANSSDSVAPGFGPLWTWSSSVCAGWPFKATGVYHGPYEGKPANGMLIMNTLHDPATPYTGAKALRRLQPTSRLVTVSGWGHGVLDSSGCASWLRTKYLTTGQLPATDTTCAPDHELFSSLD